MVSRTDDTSPHGGVSQTRTAAPREAVSTGPDTPEGWLSRSQELAGLRVVAARHPWRWVGTAVVLVALAMITSSLVGNPRWEWNVVAEFFTAESILRGVVMTLQLTAVAGVGGFLLGVVLALMRLSSSPVLASVSWAYAWVFRGVPLILQLVLWYNVAYLYQTLSVGIPFGPAFATFESNDLIDKFGAAIIGLTLHEAAYFAEIVRAGILSVDAGQNEAAASLGLPRRRQVLRIVLPQAMRTIVPNGVNQIIGLLKGTSVVYVIALGDLFYTVQVIYSRTQKVVPMLIVAALWYLVMVTIITVIQYYVERHYAKGAVRNLPPTPFQQLRAVLAGRGRPTPTAPPVTTQAGAEL